MRAMIVAAGRGTRLRPLSELRPKPVLPVRGLPLIAHPLALLAHHGVREIVVNSHHLAEMLESTARRFCPEGVTLHFSRETTLAGTGGALRRVADFLRESDPCVVLGGDMLLDVDLGALVRDHVASGAAVTLLLREDPRAAHFGSVGVDRDGVVRRIGSRFHFASEPAEEARSGVYVWANVISRRALDDLPEREVFGHFDDWLAPRLAAGARDVRGVFLPCRWEPVGTLEEYFQVQWSAPRASYLDATAAARAAGARIGEHCILGAGAVLGAGARLDRVVVWDGEHVPAGLRAEHGVFAGGRFHPIRRSGEAGRPGPASHRGEAGHPRGTGGADGRSCATGDAGS